MKALVGESVGRKVNRAFRDGKSALQEETMSDRRYYIVGNNDMWVIQFKDAEKGQFRSSDDATSFAIATAQRLGMRGERAHVCLLDDDGRLRCKWSYNRDRRRLKNPSRLLGMS